MTLQGTNTWEYRLLGWAEHTLKTHIPGTMHPADNRMLGPAYKQCEAYIRTHSKTFYIASGLLPPHKREAARALYAFCRITDDIVDEKRDKDEAAIALDDWRRRALAAHPPACDTIAHAWADTRARFGIPVGYAEHLIDGVARDLKQTRYETFTDLAEYSYGVASTVGLMAMHIIGFASEEALPYAVKLGVALQITNILRDVAADWRSGRVYLPQEELKAFGLSDVAIAAGTVTDRWRSFMRFQIERNRRLYTESLPGIRLLDKDGRFAIAAAAELYRAILDEIEAKDYDVFSSRAHLSTMKKLSRLPGIWRRSRQRQTLLSAHA